MEKTKNHSLHYVSSANTHKCIKIMFIVYIQKKFFTIKIFNVKINNNNG